MSVQPWQTAKLLYTIDETPRVRRFFFEVPELEQFSFIPGQFVTLDLPISDRPSKRLRSYTIASTPDNSNRFELVIVLLEPGSGSHYLFENSNPGHELKFRGPLGHFVLPEVIERDICFICTGTGIAPFRSQLHYLHQQKIAVKQIHLVFGSRFKSDLLYYEELLQLEKEFPEFHLHITLSRETPENWSGPIGYVHAIYEEICDHGKKDMDFYLCGWRMMIDEAKIRIKDMGYPAERIKLEIYG